MSVGFNGSFPAPGGVGARAPRDRISKASMLSPPLVRYQQGFAPTLRVGTPDSMGSHAKRARTQMRSTMPIGAPRDTRVQAGLPDAGAL